MARKPPPDQGKNEKSRDRLEKDPRKGRKGEGKGAPRQLKQAAKAATGKQGSRVGRRPGQKGRDTPPEENGSEKGKDDQLETKDHRHRYGRLARKKVVHPRGKDTHANGNPHPPEKKRSQGGIEDRQKVRPEGAVIP